MCKNWCAFIVMLLASAATVLTPGDLALADKGGNPNGGGGNGGGGPGGNPTHYVVDLGTLGGSYSRASRINEAGQVIGSSSWIDETSRGFLLTPEDTDGDGAPDLWFRDSDQDGVNDLMADFDVIGPFSNVYDINDLGQAVGTASAAQTSPLGFVWQDANGNGRPDATEWFDLGSYDGRIAEPRAINNLGEVAGILLRPGPETPHDLFLLTPETVDTGGDGRWFLDADGDGNNDLITRLGAMPYDPTAPNRPGGGIGASGLNDAGEIIGFAVTYGVQYDNEYHAFLLRPEDGDGDGSPDTWYRDDDGDPATNELFLDLGTFGGSESRAEEIVDDGTIVGFARDANTGHPTVWQVAADGSISITDLGIPPGFAGASASGTNDAGLIVGGGSKYRGHYHNPNSTKYPNEPFVWQNGEAVALEELVSDLGGFDDLDTAIDVNNGGFIIGWERIGDRIVDPTRAFIAVPIDNSAVLVPEPGSLVLIGMALCPWLIGRQRRRRSRQISGLPGG